MREKYKKIQQNKIHIIEQWTPTVQAKQENKVKEMKKKHETNIKGQRSNDDRDKEGEREKAKRLFARQ